jgi:hypothetical protein
VVDPQQVGEYVGIVVPVLHGGDRHLLFVGQALHRTHHRLERRLGRMLTARSRPLHRLGEQVDRAAVRLGQLGMSRAWYLDRPVAECLGQRGQPGRDQVILLLGPDPQPGFGGGAARTHIPGGPILADQQEHGDEHGGE